MIATTSPHSAADTVDRLVAAVEAAGATVFATVNHAAGAESIGETIPANVMVMFGNPKIGTPAIQAAPTAGLDLPLRVVIFEDSNGAVQVVYHDPADLAAAHGVPADAPVVAAMTGALGALTAAAVAP